jgi:hypothetical protein
MNTHANLLYSLAEFFVEGELFQTNSVDESKHTVGVQ